VESDKSEWGRKAPRKRARARIKRGGAKRQRGKGGHVITLLSIIEG
jgi:hypothetical protein